MVATGTRHIEEMGSLAKRMPWTALFFLVGAAAISGLPLLNGFVSEWLLFQAFLFGFHLSSEALVRLLSGCPPAPKLASTGVPRRAWK